MRHTLLIAAGAVLLSGPVLAQDGGPRIDDIVWPGIDSYCSFMRADHQFVFDDPSSWRWVLFTNLPSEGEDTIERPFMRIDGQLKELMQTGMEEIDGGVRRTYTTHDASPYSVVLTMLEGAKGYENTGFSGSLSVSRDGVSSETAYKGDCGV